jgi:3',5'-cyclic AMP phosphodiesterase CpdA
VKLNRRQLLLAGALGGISLAAYSYRRGIRIPTLHWDPALPAHELQLANDVEVTLSEFIKVSTTANVDHSFRAFAPEPRMLLVSQNDQTIRMSANNIAQDAALILSENASNVDETVNGITRELTIELKAGKPMELKWALDQRAEYNFAAIGDTGGNHELKWCLQRASDLGARFLLHLGDFNYQEGDYQRSIELFRDSPIPVYVTIGNHDFHENGAIYGHFLNEIGPLNNAFSIAKTRFVNVDTASNTLPFSAGYRGQMFDDLAARKDDFNDTIAFTHRPLYDPSGDTTHDIGSPGERDWLIASLKRINCKTLLSGHIHIYDRRDFNGIDNIIAGQGLGHQDLLVGRDYSHLAIGNVNNQGKVNFSKAALAMPMELHCHPRIQPVKESLIEGDGKQLIELVNQACKGNA